MRNLLCVLRGCGLVIVASGTWCAAQSGPTLPPAQEFPDPTNANKPVSPPDVAPEGGEPSASEAGPRTAPSLLPERLPRAGRGATRFNVGLSFSEVLLNELVAEGREETNAVCDRILGANVRGSQRTTARTRIDCRRSPRGARFDVVLDSFTTSSTVGVRPDAAVTTEGCHRALLTKPVYFEADVLTTRAPHGFVRANNRNRGIATPFTAVPMLGPIAHQLARQQNDVSRPAAEAIAAERITHRVVPQFNQSVDKLLGNTNRLIQNNVREWLTEHDLSASRLLASTTDTELRLRLGYGAEREIETPGQRVAGRLGSALIHESAVNQWIEAQNYGGREISDRELQRLLTRGQDNGNAEAGSTEPMLFSVVLANDKPVRVRFDRSESEIIVRLRVRPIVGELSDPLEIHLPFAPSVDSDRLRISLREPRVRSTSGPLSGAVEATVTQAISRYSGGISLPSTRSVSLGGTRTLVARVGRIEPVNGWLLIAVD